LKEDQKFFRIEERMFQRKKLAIYKKTYKVLGAMVIGP
jgi:hypothetical protein